MHLNTRHTPIAVLLLTVACGGASPDETKLVERGLSVYQVECARCHGLRGRGDGPQAVFLYPKPRNFAMGSFRVASNEGNFPTDSGLLRVIREGMPGSAMPPFRYLTDADSEALVAAVKHLAVEGKVEEILETTRERDEPMGRAEATELARDLFTPGAPVVLPSEPPLSETSLAGGKELFERMCSACHAPDSHQVKRDMTDDTGAFVYPRDLERALLVRGDSPEDLALTVIRGIPGTPMPSYELPGKDLWPLVQYVKSLLPAKEVVTPPAEPARTITLTGVADPGVWTEDAVQVGYQGRAPVAAARIVLHEGEEVILVLKSADVTHTFYSPELGLGPFAVYPGRPKTVRFRAPAPGEYEYFCTSLCGHCHYSMKGSIRVVSGDQSPVGAAGTDSCAEVHDLPSGISVVEKGELLYRRMQCDECHGEAGRGGVRNFNALPTARVPSLDRVPESLMFWGPREKDVQALLELLGKGMDLHSLSTSPPFPEYETFLLQYDLFRQIVLAGRFTPPNDPDGPEPPLQMPAFQGRLGEDEIDALLAYFLSLSDVGGPEAVTQPIAFNHALHVVDAGLSCQDCHANVRSKAAAGIPANTVCRDCHGPEDREADSSQDLLELIQYLERDSEIPWNRVHRLPDHVRFSHARHVQQAGLSCERCHGEISSLKRPPAAPVFRLRMSWCIDCHRQRGASEDCRACHNP